MTAIVLLLAEFSPPKAGEQERRHIVSAFKLVQDLLAVPKSAATKGKNGFQMLMDELPPEHKARWLAGAALTSADQAMASVMSTVMSRLNAFLDTELEQVICYDSPINAEMVASQKCAIFLILPEEDPAKNFIAALMMERPLLTADELKAIPKGEFVVMKTGTHPMRTRLRLFLDWGITFDPDGYRMPERAARKIAYVDHDELARSIRRRYTKNSYNPYNMEGGR